MSKIENLRETLMLLNEFNCTKFKSDEFEVELVIFKDGTAKVLEPQEQGKVKVTSDEPEMDDEEMLFASVED